MCNDFYDHNWETEFLALIGPRHKFESTFTSQMDKNEEEVEEDAEDTLPQQKLKLYKEVLHSLNSFGTYCGKVVWYKFILCPTTTVRFFSTFVSVFCVVSVGSQVCIVQVLHFFLFLFFIFLPN